MFSSTDDAVADILIKDVDVSLFVPSRPEWTKDHKNNEIIALVDREWNRQQVVFERDSENISVRGGDGFEQKELYTVELARNCLKAGL